jgi:hypothetical protein
MLFTNFQIYDTRYVPFSPPFCPTTLYFYTHHHNFMQKLNMYNLSTHPPHVPTTTYLATFATCYYIHPSLIHICLPLPTLYLPKPFPNIHYQPPGPPPPHIISIPFLSNFTSNTHLTYHPHTPLSPSIIQSHNTIFSILLTSTIPPLTPFQCSFSKTPLSHYLNVTSSPHSTPSYHKHIHHSFFPKVPTYPLLIHPYHPFTTSHCPYISSNHQYIYPSSTLTTYQLSSNLSTLPYYKLSLSSPSTLNRIPTSKYLILYPIHPHPATRPNNHTPTHISYHTLPLILFLRPSYLILPLLCVVYHILHHFHAPSTTKYFPSLLKPSYIVSTCLFLPLGSNIETHPGLGWGDTTLLNLPISSFISSQIPSPHTPPFQYLHITSSLHNAPSHHINTHHSFSTKLSNLPIISYPYHPFTPNHCPYISSNYQYIYPTRPLIQTLIYQVPSISFTLIYYKLPLSSLSTIHRTLTLKNLIFYSIAKSSLYGHYATRLTNHTPIKTSYYTLPLSFFLPSNHLILSPPCRLYHTLYHSHTSSNKNYFSNPSYIKPHYIVPTHLFLFLGGDIEINP